MKGTRTQAGINLSGVVTAIEFAVLSIDRVQPIVKPSSYKFNSEVNRRYSSRFPILKPSKRSPVWSRVTGVGSVNTIPYSRSRLLSPLYGNDLLTC